MKTIKTTLLLLFLLGTIFVGSNVARFNAPTYNPDSTTLNRLYWLYEIEHVGPEKAYKEFKEKNGRIAFDYQHLSVHVFGELLYETEGLLGIQYCDPSFGFGCYHGFFGRALSEEGVSAVKELDAICVEIYTPLGTGCQHGIGHGIMEYVGGNRINEALELCKETTQLTPLLGCTSGVFMEYNRPLSTKEGVTLSPEPRPFDESNPYDPCISVDEKFRDSCFFELGQRYSLIFREDAVMQTTLCSGLHNSRDVRHCYMGVGADLAPAFAFDVDLILSKCAAMGAQGELFCRAGASWSYYADPEKREQSGRLCMMATEEDTNNCKQLADLTEGLETKKP